jgi:UDP-glucose 4-epimerase
MTVMITGGAGYIGSHTCVALISAGHDVVIYDGFANSHPETLSRIERITGVRPAVVTGDVRDEDAMVAALKAHRCESVIHFAGLKAVGESVTDAALYYDCNVVGSLKLVKAMQATDVSRLVFSSSATVYGEPDALPLSEDHKLAPFSPYGRTKMIVEDMLTDIVASSNPLDVAILRYFNPVGSHESGLIGEDPRGIPNNVMPYISQVAVGRRQCLNVFGNDYPTRDGTGVRDYVHVVDLAAGHLRALERLDERNFIKVNLGTGRGSSVLELVNAFSSASGKTIPVEFAPRRAGDIASYYASPALAEKLLGWKAERGLAEMCEDAWRWQSLNPNGYGNR